jgi:deoxyhypusine synthase
MGEAALFEQHPAARGYLRPRAGYRLMDRREELVERLFAELRARGADQGAAAEYPLAPLSLLDAAR